MTTPASMSELSTTAASNNPAGSDAPSTIDDQIRALAAIVRQNVTKGSDIASASAITIPASGNYFVVTGTTGITGISDTNSWYGREVVLKFSGALTITHSASLILPGAANITTAAGAVAKFVSESVGVWRCTGYTKADGVAGLGANTFTGLQSWAASSDIASAATVDLSTATGNVTRITGTTATSAFTMNAGQWHLCIADGAWPLTYHATTNKLNTGGSNYTCAAGDRVLLNKDDDGIIQATIFPTSGKAVVGTTTLTPIATTSGSSQTHSSLPTGIKKITVTINGVSSNGTAVIGIQLGDSGGLETTGYGGCVNNFNGAGLASLGTGGFYLSTSGAAAQVLEGSMELTLVDSSTNTWAATWIMSRSDGTTGIYTGSGTKSLTGTLDRVAIVTTDTFDAGKFGLTYTV